MDQRDHIRQVKMIHILESSILGAPLRGSLKETLYHISYDRIKEELCYNECHFGRPTFLYPDGKSTL